MNQQYYDELKESVRTRILFEKYFCGDLCGVNSPKYITWDSHLNRLDNGQMSYDEMEQLNFTQTIQSHKILQTLQPFHVEYNWKYKRESENTAICKPNCYLTNDFMLIGFSIFVNNQFLHNFSIGTVSESYFVFLIKKWQVIVENIKKIYASGYRIHSTHDNILVALTHPKTDKFKQIDLTVPFVE
jgi:hypothetical protein